MPKVNKSAEKKEKKKNSALQGFDLTLPFDKNKDEDIRRFLQENCKNYVYQIEEGKSGYKHYQLRFRLRTAARLLQVGNKIKDYNLHGTLTRTSEEVFVSKNFNYCMKSEGRLEGPWSDKDIPPKEEAPIVTVSERAKKYYDDFGKHLHPFQVKVQELAQAEDEDHIHVILDKDGLSGKSRMHCYLCYKGLAMPIPCMNDLTKMMGFVAAMGEQPCFTGDIPRAFNKKGQSLHEFFAAIEQIKTGMIMEWRYTTKIGISMRPNIILFTNNDLPKDCITNKRLVFWHIRDKELIPGHPDESDCEFPEEKIIAALEQRFGAQAERGYGIEGPPDPSA